MSIFIVALLILVGTVGAAVLAVAIPVLLGVMASDAIVSRKNAPAAVEATDPEPARVSTAARRIYLERGVARAFVILGGAFWGIAAFAGFYSYRKTGVAAALLAACVPLFASLVTLVIGWYWERLTAAMLAIASVGVVYWGVVAQFEVGVWILMSLFLIAPMLTAAVMFWMARSEQLALELSLTRPELAMATAKRTY